MIVISSFEGTKWTLEAVSDTKCLFYLRLGFHLATALCWEAGSATRSMQATRNTAPVLTLNTWRQRKGSSVSLSSWHIGAEGEARPSFYLAALLLMVPSCSAPSYAHCFGGRAGTARLPQGTALTFFFFFNSSASFKAKWFLDLFHRVTITDGFVVQTKLDMYRMHEAAVTKKRNILLLLKPCITNHNILKLFAFNFKSSTTTCHPAA